MNPPENIKDKKSYLILGGLLVIGVLVFLMLPKQEVKPQSIKDSVEYMDSQRKTIIINTTKELVDLQIEFKQLEKQEAGILKRKESLQKKSVKLSSCLDDNLAGLTTNLNINNCK